MFHCSVIKDQFCIAVCLKQLCYYIMSFPACQELFQLFLKLVYVFDSSATTFASYHNSLYIVKNFFHFFDSIVFVSCNSDIIAFISVFVNCLFTFFYIFFTFSLMYFLHYLFCSRKRTASLMLSTGISVISVSCPTLFMHAAGRSCRGNSGIFRHEEG